MGSSPINGKNCNGKWSLVALLAMIFLQVVSVGAQDCSGYFCDKHLDTMFILMAHNSFHTEGFNNQNSAEPQQFLDGIRGFNMDVYDEDDGTVYMKHDVASKVDYETRVQEILAVMEGYENEFVLVQLEDYIDTDRGLFNTYDVWGDKLITNFDINKNLGHYIEQGKQVLLVTNNGNNIDPSVGMHSTFKLLSENKYDWTDSSSSPNMRHRRGPTQQDSVRYATLLNYFCSDRLFKGGSESNSAVVNQKARMQCHAQEFKNQPYTKRQINVMMIDFYKLPRDQDNALDAQAAIRNNDFGGQTGTNCASASNGGGGGGFCFSPHSTVEIKDKGHVSITNLRLNDEIRTNVGKFSKVYAFGNRNLSRPTMFTKIVTTTSTIELTPDHMVFLVDKTLPITAASVKVGDKLKSGTSFNGGVEVVEVGQVYRDGFFTPLTTDGKIVVDGIVASNYAGKAGSEYYLLNSNSIHYHEVSHIAVAPIRFACTKLSNSFCDEGFHFGLDSVEHPGKHKFVAIVHSLKHFVNDSESCGPVLHLLLFLVVIGLGTVFYALEKVYYVFALVFVIMMVLRFQRMSKRVAHKKRLD